MTKHKTRRSNYHTKQGERMGSKDYNLVMEPNSEEKVL